MGLAQRAAGVLGVLRVAEHRPAADGARAAQDAVALAGLVAHGGRQHLGADELQRAGIAQCLQALQRRQRVLLLAAGAGLEAATLAQGAIEDRAHGQPHSRTVAPQVNPAPNAPRSTRSPGDNIPSRSLKANASGRVAAEVFPYWPMQSTTRPAGRPSRSPTADRILPLAWW